MSVSTGKIESRKMSKMSYLFLPKSAGEVFSFETHKYLPKLF